MTAADPAWTPATAPLTLPFYYRFDFHTSDEGDFESLVRALTPPCCPHRSVSGPWTSASRTRAYPRPAGPWDWTARSHSASTRLRGWIPPRRIPDGGPDLDQPDSPANRRSGQPGPDRSGHRPADLRPLAGGVSVDRTAAGWENDLNLDPRNRTAAGMGTQIVQGERTQLMASAWQQVEGVLKANQMLARPSSRARPASKSTGSTWPGPARDAPQPHSPLQLAAARQSDDDRGHIRASRVPERMFSGAFRKLAHLPRRLGMATPPAHAREPSEFRRHLDRCPARRRRAA